MSFFDKKRILKNILPQLVSESEDTAPQVLSGRNQRNLTEEEWFIAETSGAPARPTTPLQKEWVDYNTLAGSFKGENPLNFWAKNAKQFPILARVARRILCAPPTSSQVERLFSASGRVCTFDRSRLKPMNVDILTSLYMWYSLDLLDKSTTALQGTAQARSFASHHIDETDDNPAEVLMPVILNDDDENDECDDEHL